MLGAFFTSSSIRHLPSSMQNDRHYSDSWLHLFTVISTMMRKGYVHENLSCKLKVNFMDLSDGAKFD